jgi:putative endonuclease
MQEWHWYVYIIECADGTYYTGMTWNVADRFDQHVLAKGLNYTSRHGTKRLVYHEIHDALEVARARELQIKNWSRLKKEKLISGEWGKEW